MREPFPTEHGEAPADVVVVGAGPVGLTLALGLGRAGVEVLVLEQRSELPQTSRAIGVTPASLEILDRYGVAEELVAAGVRVRHAAIHGDRGEVARVGFDHLKTPFPFILSLPQRQTEEILLRAVERLPSVRLLRGRHVSGYTSGTGLLRVCATAPGEAASVSTRYLVGCDGKHSTVRDAMGADWSGRQLTESFAMADIVDKTDLGDIAHLWFTSRGSVESFPLPSGIRRWIVQTSEFYPDPPEGLVQGAVASRAGVGLQEAPKLWCSSFRTERRIASSWAAPPVFLAGDAAHLMPPIGGQGMNVGLADAEHLSDLLRLALREPLRIGELAAAYENRRRRAFRLAARRSILGMRIGTCRGRLASTLREALIPAALAGRRGERIMEHFAMLASPYRRSAWIG
ncbi:MAG: FAD-dependent oxidoreductase [Spirochaetaceae bacterium]